MMNEEDFRYSLDISTSKEDLRLHIRPGYYTEEHHAMNNAARVQSSIDHLGWKVSLWVYIGENGYEQTACLAWDGHSKKKWR